MLEGLFDSPINSAIIALFGAMIFVGRLVACGGYCPKLSFLRRWLGVLFCSFSVAACLEFFGLERDFSVLLFCGVSLYFLVVSVYSWVVICAENFGEDIPPRFDPVDDAWIDSPKYADLMRRIESAGYKKSGSFKMKIDQEFDLSQFATTFDGENTRLCIIFPFGDGSTMVSSAKTVLADGTVLLTEARNIPNGFDYPENYAPENHPFVSNPLGLLKIHARRLSESALKPRKLDTAPFDDLNCAVNAEIAASQESGLTNPVRYWGDDGVFTEDGKFRFWKMSLMTAYFPFFTAGAKRSV